MTERRLRVLFISLWYPNRVKPLLGIFIKRHAVVIAKKADISALYVCADEKEGVEESDEENIYTIRVYYKRIKHKIAFIALCVTLVRYLNAWKKALSIYKQKKGKPDIIHSNIVFPLSLMATYLKFKWKVPYIITEQWSGYLPQDGRYRGFIMKLFSRIGVRYASAVTTVSIYLRDMMLKAKLHNSYSVISNVVDTEVFNIDSTVSKSTEVTNFLHISSLCNEEKNVSGIIQTFAKVNQKFPNTRLNIVGPKNMAVELQNLSDRLGLNNAVQFLGVKMSKELAKVINGSNAFVLFSHFETQSVVLLESLCCGVPVISSRLPAVMEYVTPANGVLVGTGNQAELYDAMVFMIKNSNTYLPNEVRKTVVERGGPDIVAQQFLDLYQKVLKHS